MIPLALILALVCFWVPMQGVTAKTDHSFTPQHLLRLKNETASLFDHAWGSYMKHGFPMDEVKPISCQGYGPNFMDPEDVIRNDALGNVSSTLLDNLDTLIILEKWDDVEMALSYLESEKNTFFDKDVIVQVFETTIRSLGGLMSAHLILSDDTLVESERFKQINREYNGFLLEMAYDLGLRLISAFKTASNIPVPRINLKRGVKAVPYKLQQETCTSGAMTPVLEMTLLSKLTGDPQFEQVSQMAFWKLWNSRSALDFLSMSISPLDQKWNDAITGIGASIDSFYEYCIKAGILFNDSHIFETFKRSYRALMTHSVKGSVDDFTSLIFANVGSDNGLDATIWIDSLSAFWTGVQVLAGQLKDAIGTHMVFMKIFDYFESIPERWNCLLPEENIEKQQEVIGLEWYPLRPEFVESTYYLYRATKDPMYLQIGERMLRLLQTKYKARCGFKGLQDIRSGRFQDRMESFVLSETLKYLYLLFDERNEVFLHRKRMDSKNWIFSTEGHPLWYNKALQPKKPQSRQLDTDSGEFGAQKFSLKNMFGKSKSISGKGDIKPEILSESFTDMTDPYDIKFYQCEVNPFVAGPTDFLKSHYYAMENLFNIDATYSRYLYKPSYLSQTNLDGSYVELTDGFYETFTMFKTPLQCPVQSNTNKLELFVGNKSEIVNSKLQIVGKHKSVYIESFTNLRVSLEFLEAGRVDSSYNYVEYDSIERHNEELIKLYQGQQTSGIDGNEPEQNQKGQDVFNAGGSGSHEPPDDNKGHKHGKSGMQSQNGEETVLGAKKQDAEKDAYSDTKDANLESIPIYDVMLRLTRVNGVFIKPGQLVVTRPPVSGDGSITNVKSRLLMNGILVENVRVINE